MSEFPAALNYSQWFEVARIARQARLRGLYRDGVEREAALAAIEVQDREHAVNRAVFDAVEDVFWRMKVGQSNWDGSIA